MKKNFKKIFLVFSLLFFFSFEKVFCQQKASLFLSPSFGTFEVGKNFTVILAVNSPQEAVNAIEATLKFDPSILKVVSISKSNSIFTLWPEEPSFSNSQGTIHFVGGSPTPYRGSSGTILSIVFSGLKEGETQISFTKGIILAGPGIDVTGELKGASFKIVLPVQPQPQPQPSGPLPPAPKISSLTHPDQAKWYKEKNVKLVWEIPPGVQAVRVLLGKNPQAQPTIVYEPPISSKEFSDLEDGIWYFSAQFKNEYGWGQIGRFKIQVDSTPPKEFVISVDNQGDPTNPKPLFKFETTDETSGIDYYELILNGESFAKVKPEEIKEGAWQPKDPLKPGSYTLEVKAFDKAGNFRLSSHPTDRQLAAVAFAIQPLPLEIFPFPKKIKQGTPLKVEGKTVLQAKVRLYIQKENKVDVKETDADKEGRFRFEEMLSLGKYTIWFEVIDHQGRIALSQKYEIEVIKEKLVIYLSILLIVLILIGLLIIIWLVRKIKKEREKAKFIQLQKIKQEREKIYLLLKEKVEEQIKYLEEKVDLSRAEKKILEALKEALKEAEKERSKIESKKIEEK